MDNYTLGDASAFRFTTPDGEYTVIAASSVHEAVEQYIAEEGDDDMEEVAITVENLDMQHLAFDVDEPGHPLRHFTYRGLIESLKVTLPVIIDCARV